MKLGNTIVVNASDYSTVQLAIDAAELLPAVNSGLDSSGVSVLVPGGNYDETLVIRKNVSLIGFGGFTTTITGLYILPSSAEDCPKNVTVSGIWFPNTIYIKNQTSNDSGIYNPDMGKWAISFVGCTWSAMEAENICNLELSQCSGSGAQSFTNCPEVNISNSTMTEGQTTFSGDSQADHQCSNLDNEEYVLNSYNSYIEDPNPVTVSGSTFPAVYNDY